MKHEGIERVKCSGTGHKSRYFTISFSFLLHLDLMFLLTEILRGSKLYFTRVILSSQFRSRTWRYGSPICHRLDGAVRVTAICGATPPRQVKFSLSSAFPPPARSHATFAAAGASGFCPRVHSIVHPRGPIQWALGIYVAARANIKANLFRARKERGERGQRRFPPCPRRPTCFEPDTRMQFMRDNFVIYRKNNAEHRLIHIQPLPCPPLRRVHKKVDAIIYFTS